MNRDAMLQALERRDSPWDVLVVGGGATGLGIAIDAAARGYATVLLEQRDFAQGTSSRSTKLVHGGVRYLKQGNVALVIEALKERGLLRANAPHLVRNLAFVVPCYGWWEGPFYGVGLKIYDLLAGRQGFGASKLLSREAVLERIPTLEPEGLTGGVVYHDGQFDDARLAVNLAQTAAEQGAVVLNYLEVTGLLKNGGGQVAGAVAVDVETGRFRDIPARVVVNATGVFVDRLRRLDDPATRPMISPSQGVHIVLDRSFLPGDTAIMVPKTDDGRVLFAIPWHERVVVGTTDTPVPEVSLEPRPLPDEVAFLLEHAARYLVKDPKPADVLSTFAGLRPLVGGEEQGSATSELSRDHTLSISESGLVTIAGGKWTTYRHMAEATVDQAAVIGDLPERECGTRSLRIHGADGSEGASASRASSGEQTGPGPELPSWLAEYGADAPALRELIGSDGRYGRPLHPRLPYLAAKPGICHTRSRRHSPPRRECAKWPADQVCRAAPCASTLGL